MTVSKPGQIILFLILFCSLFPVINVFSENTFITQLTVAESDGDYCYSYFYDEHNHLISETRSYISGSEAVLQAQTKWSYVIGNESPVLQIEREYVNKSWKTVSEIEYSYNISNHQTEENHYRYENEEKILEKSIKTEYEKEVRISTKEYRNMDGNLLLSTENLFKYTNGKLSEQLAKAYQPIENMPSEYLLLFSYSATEDLESMILKEKGPDGEWKNSELTNWFYTKDSNKILSQRRKKWSEKTNNWINTQLLDYEYDENSVLIAETYQLWTGLYWKNICRYEYTYEEEKRIKRTLQFPLYKEWRDIISIRYSDFVHDMPSKITSQYEFWGGNTGELTLSHIPFVFNNDYTVREGKSIQVSYITKQDNTNSNSIVIYPNPSQGVFYINPKSYNITAWSAYDVKGLLIKKQVKYDESKIIDLTNAPQGFYIIQMETDSGYHRVKVIKR